MENNDDLNDNEKKVLLLSADDLSIKEMAPKHFKTSDAARGHAARAMKKMKVGRMGAAIAKAHRTRNINLDNNDM